MNKFNTAPNRLPLKSKVKNSILRKTLRSLTITLSVLISISCVSFNEHYSLSKKINISDDIISVIGKDTDSELLNILKIDLQRKGVKISGFIPEDIIDYIDNYLAKETIIRKKEKKQNKNSSPPRLPLSFAETDAYSLNYHNFITNFFKTSRITRILYIKSDINSYTITLFSYDEKNSVLLEDFNYFVISSGTSGWRNNFKIVYDRDISYGTVYENDILIPYKLSIKRKYELSKRITDIITGEFKDL